MGLSPFQENQNVEVLIKLKNKVKLINSIKYRKMYFDHVMSNGKYKLLQHDLVQNGRKAKCQ